MHAPFSCQMSIPTRDNFLEFYFTPKTLFFMLLRKNYYENLPTQNLEDPVKISDQEMASINLKRHDFHGEWNYTICP